MKVLILSHNPVSTYNGMGKTIDTFFSNFDKSELIQLYIYPSLPDVDTCSSYYRITDKDILKSYFRFGIIKGTVIKNISSTAAVFENEKDEKIYLNSKNKSPIRILLRDLMWKCSRWYNSSLSSWLKSEDPDCIFLAPGGAKFIYDMALKISEKLNIPIVTYIADEYFFVNPDKRFCGNLQLRLLKNKMIKTLNKSTDIITISKEFENLYAKEFNSNVCTIMTGSTVPISQRAKVSENVNIVSYFGNLAYNRYLSLVEIGKALDEINKKHNTEIELHIYSSQKNNTALEFFEKVSSIHWKGFISGEEYEDTFNSSELLIHTEYFDEYNIDLVKHSISTKIADSLASGIPMFAYGPECVSSIKYLISNNCAIIATTHQDLCSTLENALFDKNLRTEVSDNAIIAATKFHDKNKNSDFLRQIIIASLGDKNERTSEG